MMSLGVDPGAHGAMALVASPAPGGRPVLVGVWRVDKPDLGAYYAVACQVFQRVAAILAGATPAITVEDIPPFGQARTAAGLARRQGLLLGALFSAGLQGPVLLNPLQWAGAYGGHVRRGKADGGAHRLVEAAALVDCRGLTLTVDQAEAVLIAGSALLLRGEWRLDHLPEVGKKVRADHLRGAAEMMPAKKTRKKATAEESSGVRKARRGRQGPPVS